MDSKTLHQRITSRWDDIKVERASFLSHWEEISNVVSPRSMRWLVKDASKGRKRNQLIFNSRASVALRTLKSGMMAGLTSQARPWFQLTIQDPDLAERSDVKAWLFLVQERIRMVFSASNLYQTIPMVYESLGGYGTGAQLILDDFDSVIRCHSLPIGQYAIAVDETGRVDTLMRLFPMTVRQIVNRFGRDVCSYRVQRLYDNARYEDKIEVLHSIGPSPWREVGNLTAKHKPYHDIYLEYGQDDDGKVLMQSGYDEFPAQCPRWDITASDDIYGYSPGMDALPDIKELQLTARTKTDIKNKIATPPLLADSVFRQRRTSLIPGDITYQENLGSVAHPAVRPLLLVPPEAVNVLEASERELEQRISRVFYEDLMLMFATSDDPVMTAREVAERHEEKMLVLGPVLERLNCELLDPIIERTFAIMQRRGLVPPAPESMRGNALRIEYVSIMAQAQKLIGVSSVNQFFGFVGNLSAMKPEVLDKINVDETVNNVAGMYGIPPKMINSDDQVQAVRDARAQQMQAQQMAQAMPALSQAATAAKTLSDIPVNQPSALQMLLTGGA